MFKPGLTVNSRQHVILLNDHRHPPFGQGSLWGAAVVTLFLCQYSKYIT
jgi:hypothetical protein